MSDQARTEFLIAWQTQRRRALHQNTRGILTPEESAELGQEAERRMSAIEREAGARALEQAADRFAAEDDPEWGYWQDYEGWSIDPSEPLRARAAEIRERGGS